MAIGIHIVRIGSAVEVAGTVEAVNTVPNASGNPTIEDFLQDEADDNYAVNSWTDSWMVLYNVHDMNGA